MEEILKSPTDKKPLRMIKGGKIITLALLIETALFLNSCCVKNQSEQMTKVKEKEKYVRIIDRGHIIKVNGKEKNLLEIPLARPPPIKEEALRKRPFPRPPK